MQIAICDDDAGTTAYMESLLLKICNLKKIAVEISIFFSGEELLSYIHKNHFFFDLIYLDIEMEHMNGIETAKRLRAFDDRLLLIFISAYDQYCKQLFEVEPFRFLDKPILTEQFDSFFLAAIKRITASKRMLSFHYQHSFYQLPLQEIIYLESQRRLVIVHSTLGEYQFYGKLNELEHQLENSIDPFFRIHQSFFVNYRFIYKITYQTVELKNHTILPISEGRREKLQKDFISMIRKEQQG